MFTTSPTCKTIRWAQQTPCTWVVRLAEHVGVRAGSKLSCTEARLLFAQNCHYISTASSNGKCQAVRVQHINEAIIHTPFILSRGTRWWEVRGHVHALVALPSRNNPRQPTKKRLGGPQSRSACFIEGKKSLSVIEPRIVEPVDTGWATLYVLLCY